MATTYRLAGATTTEREHRVPLDHARPDGPSITVFTREVAALDGGDRPYLLFLQGGPGFEATRPTSPPSGWMARALRDYRVLLIDQRGTGRSTPLGATVPGATPAEQIEYLALFRADSIVRDAELIRRELGVERWSILGQSFGGFCALTYLSIAPDGLAEAIITGGLASIGQPIDEAYRLTYAEAERQLDKYFGRYPDDRARLAELFRRIENEALILPSGDRLTTRRFRQLGAKLGDHAGFEGLHHILELPADSRAFLTDVEEACRYGRNPIYVALQEACWADGTATDWAAQRLLPDRFEEEGFLYGEHFFPWMYEDYAGLRGWREVGELAARRTWPRLFDEAVLARNEVPVAATIYVEDLYVPAKTARETAAKVRGLRAWETNEYVHSGLRADERVLDRLIGMVKGRV